MVKIELEGRGFVGALLSLNQKSDYSTNIFEILYFAITYGYKSLRRANFAEMARRLITVYGALEKKKTPHDYKYVKKSCYINSNSNEKAYISYVLGMTLCKFVAKKTLGFDMLLHYDMLANTHGFSISRNLLSNERPDFIGFDKKINNI